MPSIKRKVTKTVVDGLQPGQVCWDTELTGFGVRCQRRDKVYIFKTRIGHRQRWFSIGKHGHPWTIEQARDQARIILGEIKDDKDPATKRDIKKTTLAFANFADEWIGEVEADRKPRTVEQYRDIMNRIAKPALGRLLITDVQTRDITALKSNLRDRKVLANRVLAVLSSFFSWCEDENHRPKKSNPVQGIRRYKEEKRKRHLSTDEMSRLGTALSDVEQEGDESPFVVAAIRLLLFTGARRSEILTLKWDWVDFESAQIRLPDSKTDAKEIYLSAPALEVLSRLPRIVDNPHVIVGQRVGRHLVNIAKPWKRIRERAGLQNFRVHDLRHSFASVGVSGGASLPMIGGLLGQSNASTTQRYSHLQSDPVRAVNEAIGAQIAATMRGDTAEIVPLGRKAGGK